MRIVMVMIRIIIQVLFDFVNDLYFPILLFEYR